MRQLAPVTSQWSEWFRVNSVKSPSKGIKHGNDLFYEQVAVAETIPHKKASFGSNVKLVPKLANTPRWVLYTKGVLIDATGTVLTYPGNKTLIAQYQNVKNGNSLPL